MPSTTPDPALANYRQLTEEIHAACHDCGRDPESVKLVLVTKTVPVSRIRPIFEAGHRLFGENKVQELIVKSSGLNNAQAHFHFIGHLQSNKAKKCVEHAAMIHSVDRISIARALQRHLEVEGRPMDVLLQVNTSREESKFGVTPAGLPALAREVAQLPLLRIRGLMTLAMFSPDEAVVRPCFQLLRTLREQIRESAIEGVEMSELSMGMSSDFPWAIAEGATIIRVGTAVFGHRPTPDSSYWPETKP